MATVKKLRKYGEGGGIPCPGGNCKKPPKMSGSSYKAPKGSTSGGSSIKWTKKEEREAEATNRGDLDLKGYNKYAGPRNFPNSTINYKTKGSESDKTQRWQDSKEGIAKNGKKISKKSAPKKAAIKKSSKKK